MTALELLRITERETLKFRLLILFVVSASVLFRVRELPVLPIVAVVSGYLLYSAVLRTVLIPRFTSYPLLGGMLFVDAATLLAVLYLIGLNSPVVMLLPISVVYYALSMSYLGGLLMAVAVSFGFVGLALGTGRLEELANIIAIQVPSSFLLALLVGYLAQARLRESEERRVYQQIVQAEARGRRFLQLAESLQASGWRDLAPVELARATAALVGLPWAALLLADERRASLSLAGANYPTASGGALTLEEAGAVGVALREGREVEEDLAPDAAPPFGPRGAEEKPGYLCAMPLNGRPSGVLCIFAPTGTRLDARGKETLRAFAPLAAHLLGVYQAFAQVERQSRELVGELRSTVESTGRLTQVQARRTLQFGSLVIDPQRERVRLGPQGVQLSRTEFDLLYYLAANAGVVFNSETLLREVWGPDYVPQGKPVDVAVHRLRRKLDTFPGGAGLIRTVRGRGYTFAQAEAAALSPEAASHPHASA